MYIIWIPYQTVKATWVTCTHRLIRGIQSICTSENTQLCAQRENLLCMMCQLSTQSETIKATSVVAKIPHLILVTMSVIFQSSSTCTCILQMTHCNRIWKKPLQKRNFELILPHMLVQSCQLINDENSITSEEAKNVILW